MARGNHFKIEDRIQSFIQRFSRHCTKTGPTGKQKMQKNECSRLKEELQNVLGSLEELLSAASLNEETAIAAKKVSKGVSKAIINSEQCCLLSRKLLQQAKHLESACQNESLSLISSRDKKERLSLRVEELQAQLHSVMPPPNGVTPALGQLLSQKRLFDESIRTLTTISIASAIYTARMDDA